MYAYIYIYIYIYTCIYIYIYTYTCVHTGVGRSPASLVDKLRLRQDGISGDGKNGDRINPAHTRMHQSINQSINQYR